jgi:DNA-binding NtrC family response regulator
MMTGYGTIESAVSAMKLGAFDYVNKPFNTKTISTIIKLALETQKLKKEVGIFQDKDKSRYGVDKIVGHSKSISQTLELIEKISQIDSSTVLIQGESGTGKELVAKAIHYNSRRCSGSFIEINCAAIPYTLLESELFGYEQGAFTDAKKAKKGLLELANGGTLFLDEIGDMDLGMQSKILNFLEERKFRRLGGDKLIEADVRIVAATNHNLREEVKKKRFREDLFYRLNVINIYLQPLRERQEDIIPLAEYFINEFNRQFKKAVRGITPEAGNILKQYSWPGNIRELKNVIERIMIIDNPETIQIKHLPIEITGKESSFLVDIQVYDKQSFEIPNEGIDLRSLTNSVQKNLIKKALQKTGNKSQAAKLLKMDRFSLRYLMKKLQIS